MDFAKTHTLESKAYPGVAVKLARLGPRARASLELSLAEPRGRERELTICHDMLRLKLNAMLDKVARYAAPDPRAGQVIEEQLSPEAIDVADRWLAAGQEVVNVQRALIYPAFVRAVFLGCNDELTYEGQPATADLLIEHGPDDLFNEVMVAINSNGYLSAEQSANLNLPTTSAAAADGKTEITSAEAAKSESDSPSSAAA